MSKSLAFFNHKGGVGKTTLIVNLAGALGRLGLETLVVDCDPQCNATAFYLPEKTLDDLLNDSVDPEEGGTLWSGIARHARGRGDVRAVTAFEVGERVKLVPGDVLLGSFEDRLSSAWKDSYSQDPAAIDLMSAIYRCIAATASQYKSQVVLIDMGPNIGPLNRAVLLGADAYAVPVGCDLFSLRALRALGQTVTAWAQNWSTISDLAAGIHDITLLPGQPAFVGYITQHFNIYAGRSARAFEEWEKQIAPRVARDVVTPLRQYDPILAPDFGSNKIAEVPSYHSLAPLSHRHGVPIAELAGHEDVNSGWNPKIAEARQSFMALATAIRRRLSV